MNLSNLDVVIENASYLSETDNTAFNAARKNGLGASDASVFLGLMKWKSKRELIAEKLRLQPTPEDLAISELENVRRGKDLEPLILQKFCKQFGVEVAKPEAMYRLKAYPFLTVNFDGILEENGRLIPVECKYVSKYGTKYWQLERAINSLTEPGTLYEVGQSVWEDMAISYGPPAYYIAQIQQQMLALDAPHGYFSVIFDDGWKHMTFRVESNKQAIEELVLEGYKTWREIESLR